MAASTFGPQWSLRYAFAVFVGATVLAILLPARVDSAAGEDKPSISTLGIQRRRRPQLPRNVATALRATTGMRLLSGFLTLFMAFLLRDEPFPGWEDRPELLLALVVGSAGVGSTVGIALGSLLRRISPSVTVVATLLADLAAALVVTVLYGLPTAVLLGLTAGLAQSLGQALAGRAHPAGDPRAHPGRHVRPLRDPAAAGLGGRRLHRHRAAAGAPARPGGGLRDPAGLDGVDADGRTTDRLAHR